MTEDERSTRPDFERSADELSDREQRKREQAEKQLSSTDRRRLEAVRKDTARKREAIRAWQAKNKEQDIEKAAAKLRKEKLTLELVPGGQKKKQMSYEQSIKLGKKKVEKEYADKAARIEQAAKAAEDNILDSFSSMKERDETASRNKQFQEAAHDPSIERER